MQVRSSRLLRGLQGLVSQKYGDPEAQPVAAPPTRKVPRKRARVAAAASDGLGEASPEVAGAPSAADAVVASELPASEPQAAAAGARPQRRRKSGKTLE